ncbi:MAG: hypothetical protein A3E37_04445 [Candidatus Andersenbacteria bacterium RIFCSPHIGHO2_12_FULL_46_9]|nr:MAG: hypothetical protein A3E37_04445 [Candidatus Andersenbacteria bacterium RIFCSPHIGHO2_12_FULL_46_9]OGY35961.1 MAG: hypothetical protein A3B76_04280 [Candidatus Andersenbacteria bacterium RIFCSPHIGHO2_02_FULL_46_16]OGY37637.1 MAG: hypothetical protein A3I08_01055 [Candidatus Andersenbacteria bacterium RIFCSPLOWO2_02_FULL_46_11]
MSIWQTLYPQKNTPPKSRNCYRKKLVCKRKLATLNKKGCLGSNRLVNLFYPLIKPQNWWKRKTKKK